MIERQNSAHIPSLIVAAILGWASSGAVQAANPCTPADEQQSAPDSGGIGGTGKQASEGGIGGPGKQASEGGIGGTGIVGIITGFASICVNGMEVHYDTDTPVALGGVTSTAAHLAIGQVVSIEAGASPRGLKASRINILDVVVGPVTRIDAPGASLRVLGQNVRISPEATTPSGTVAAELARLKTGDFVRVSGQRVGSGEIIASRLEAAPSGAVSLLGPVTHVDPQGLTVGGIRVLAASASAGNIREGTEVLVSGRLVDGNIRAEHIEIDPAYAFSGPVSRLAIEGYIGIQAGNNRFAIGARTVRITETTRFDRDSQKSDLATDRRVRITGRLDASGELVAERVQARRQLIGRGEGRPRPAPHVDESRGKGEKAASSSGNREQRSNADPSDRRGNSGRNERADSPERSDRSERSSREDRPRSSERPERPERIERNDRSNDR